MILTSLINYYDRIEADPERSIAPLGYSRQKISFVVNINPDGSLHSIADARVQVEDGKKKPRLVPTQMVVLGQAKPSGSGINPCLLWDNSAYMLGYKGDDPKPERTLASFEAFRDKHLALSDEINDESFAAVCAFLKAWKPAGFSPTPEQGEAMATGFGVFRVMPAREHVHQRKAIRAWWDRAQSQDAGGEGPTAPSLTDGQPARIARLHEPAIKGVAGAQSSGARLVSFNNDAFESYGKSQSFNAPVSETDAFKYCTALNELLNDRSRRTTIGDATVVWWADEPSPLGDALFGGIFAGRVDDEPDGGAEAEDERTRQLVGAQLDRIARGLEPGALPEDAVGFNVLGLSPNAARLSVRFWWRGTLGELRERMARHHADLRLLPVPEREEGRPLSIWRMVRETARVLNDRPDMDTVSPVLAGAITRAVLGGSNFPKELVSTLLSRIRAEGEVSFARARLLKAALLREGGQMDVYLNKSHPSPAYHCGRLFAVIGRIQKAAMPEANSTVIRRFMGAAMSSPGLVLGRLEKAATIAHAPKIKSSNAREYLMDEMAAINGAFHDDVPTMLRAKDQTLFALGYFQQCASLDRWLPFIKTHKFRSKRGEWMRSSLEVIVADAFATYGIPYVYEPSIFLDTNDTYPRQPDFFIGGRSQPQELDLYIEVAGRAPGVDEQEYDKRHNIKIEGYMNTGITPEGGPRGRLLVLDYRDKPDRCDAQAVLNAVRKYISIAEVEKN